jgi:tryptophanyl-tRNA synthetase
MRGHSFKDAKAKNELEKFSVGDFTYPMLMAADILLYSPDVVPVGKDQKQHLEFARDFAQKFNNKFGEVFKLPEPVISEEVGTVIGTDGRKMSKSYKNTLPLFADENEIRETIRTIPMDSKLPEEKKNPEDYNLYKIFTLFANEKEDAQLRQMFEEGGVGYGDIKKYVVDVIIDYTKEIREKRAELEKKPEYVLEVLKQGTENAKKVAQEKMEEIKTAIGFKL